MLVFHNTYRFSRQTYDIAQILLAQAAMGAVAVLVAWVLSGWAGFVSALIGAGAYFLPNAAFALRLLLGLAAKGQASVLAFFLGELVKLALVVVVLMLAGWLGAAWLVWPALMLGLCCVLMAYTLLPLLSWWLRHRS